MLASALAATIAGPTKVLFTGSALDTGGRCLDGTAAGFYIEPANPAGSLRSTWVIYMEGGGACYTQPDCEHRAEVGLGSSKNWPEGQWPKSFDLAHDPNFADANHVFIPYCSGDEHVGMRTNASADRIIPSSVRRHDPLRVH